MRAMNFCHYGFIAALAVGFTAFNSASAEIIIDPYPNAPSRGDQKVVMQPVQTVPEFQEVEPIIPDYQDDMAFISEDMLPEPQAGFEQIAIEPPEKIIVVEKRISMSEGDAVIGGTQERVFWTDGTARKEWKALRGSNIKEILNIWSQEAGVDLIWDSEDEFAVLETVRVRNTYESAVQSLLEQYEKSYVRPVGSLHIDPEGGKRVLVVRVSQGS